METLKKHIRGFLALSPLLLFLLIYLLTSLVVGDFYKVPISAAFLVSTIYALLIQKGKNIEERITIFSRGAGETNLLLMVWIFILAGAFASTAREIGTIEATVNFTFSTFPSDFLFVGLFLSACLVSMAIGSSVGTIAALMPIAVGIANETGMSVAFLSAIIVGGSFFGDNLSFISDTTIAATKTQGCSMSDKFKANLKIVVPAALLVAGYYIVRGFQTDFVSIASQYDIVLLIPYIVVIGLAICGMNVILVLTIGLFTNAIIGFSMDSCSFADYLACMGKGIASMGDLIIITLLAGGILELIRVSGGLDYVIQLMTKRVKGKMGAEFCIALLVTLANICTANNTIAIITTGSIAKDISTKYGVNPRKSASILDTVSCFVQALLPFGAQMLMVSQFAKISPISIFEYLYYPYTLGAFVVFAIVFRFPRKIS